MQTQKAIAGIFAASALVIGGCGTVGEVHYQAPQGRVAAYPGMFGIVESIDMVSVGGGEGNVVAGTILGGVVGGVLGHQIGSGRGNDVATVAGAVGGAVVGHEIAANRGGRTTYQIRVRTDDGGVQSFLQDDIRGLRVGDRIQLSSERETRYALGGRVDERELRRETLTYSGDARGQRYDAQGNRVDERGYRVDDRGFRRDAQGYWIDERGYRVEDRGYRRDGQGYWVDARGNRYDAQGYWVDERGIRHAHQDAPRQYQVPPTN